MPLYITENLTFIIIIVGVLSLPIAWIADMLLKDYAFGVLINYIIVIIATYCGTLLTFHYFRSASPILHEPVLALGAAAICSVIILIIFCMIKKWLMK